MHTFPKSFLSRFSVTMLLMAAMLAGPGLVAAQGSDTSYTDDTHGVTLDWADSWTLDVQGPGLPGLTMIYLEKERIINVVVAIADSESFPEEEALWLMVEDDDEMIEDRSDSVPPRITFTSRESQVIYVVEVYTINDGATTVMVLMFTIPVMQESAMEAVQSELSINGSTVLAGEPVADSGGVTDLTGEGTAEATPEPSETEEATEEAGRTTRTSRDAGETPEATETEEATEEAGRTTRTSRDAGETPEATETEEATEEAGRTTRTSRDSGDIPEATEEPDDPVESLGLDTFVGPVYGYSFHYNPNVWQVSDEFSTLDMDGIRLDNETSSVLIWAMDEYGADPVGCLDGEDDYYSDSMLDVVDWGIAVDANGDPLRFESDELAWGVFTYTYVSTSGDVEFVDYISCETIPGQDAVLIVQLTSLPGDYNDNLDLVLDILDTLEFQP